MKKKDEICNVNCTCKNGDDCHVHGVLNFIDLHNSERSYQEYYAHENGEYANVCYRCRKHFLGHKRRVCCKACLPIVIEKTKDRPPFKL